MKKFNKNLVNKKLFNFIKSYSNDKHALSALLKKKNTMQTLKVNNIKSLKFFNIIKIYCIFYRSSIRSCRLSTHW